jgi:hypothetical protein
MEPEPRILARSKYNRDGRGEPGQKYLKPSQGIGRRELVEVVDHKQHRLLG